jgi:hypothetical protein
LEHTQKIGRFKFSSAIAHTHTSHEIPVHKLRWLQIYTSLCKAPNINITH